MCEDFNHLENNLHGRQQELLQHQPLLHVSSFEQSF
jgi:hypothetical protein